MSVGRYVHRRGIHCESACQCNILAAAGYDVDEDVVFGLDGSFGFSFFPSPGSDPDIVVGKQTIMPLRAARLMGVKVDGHAPKSGKGLMALLQSAPAVITRVDLGQLPYWGLEGRSSFGGYFVNVVRVVDGNRFEVSDPAFDSPVVVAATDLQAARSSRNSPPLSPDWKVYIFGTHRTIPELRLVGPVAVRNLCRDVLKPGNRNMGIPGMKQLQAAASAWPRSKRGEVDDVDAEGRAVRSDALVRQLLHLGDQIETFGTGGGLFRPMIGRFLTALALASNDSRYADPAELFVKSGTLWQNLGRTLLARATVPGADRSQLVEAVVDTVGSVVDIEKRALRALGDL
ncbi:BtrH N-terminal domain-containing protein [Frankia sp. AgKG'84/4]|uniref:BtrH N-terminal domain-containing protein n=1 Tax=Frankia sp. AgKG'84/4 TaxID=573490 RepID=UPI00200F46B3|nr:BtrH N-terminal domain-containing protein [Frankia sp. AgKG'84/4]MCL9794994.1 BtrH N-terminal domain-containing protein [Frankia sp. AgKG'84/4]